jgi:hypothetical protein
MGLLYGRAGCLTAKTAVSGPGGQGRARVLDDGRRRVHGGVRGRRRRLHVGAREKQIGGSGGSLEPLGLFLTHLGLFLRTSIRVMSAVLPPLDPPG